MEVVEGIPKVVEAEPLTQKEIEAIAGELIEVNLEKQRWYGLKIHNTFALLFLELYPISSQTRPKLNCDNLQIGLSGSLDRANQGFF